MVNADSGIQEISSSRAALWAGAISESGRGTLAAFSIPATASAGWKESGLAGELLHLGPTRNSSLVKHRTLHRVRQQKLASAPAFSSPCHALKRTKFSWIVHLLMQLIPGSMQIVAQNPVSSG